MRLAPDARRVPHALAVLLRWIPPRRLPAAKTLLHHALRLAEHHRNILERMQPIADEKRHHHDVLRPRDFVTPRDLRLLLHERRMHLAEQFARANQFHLPLDRLARILVVARPVPRDEQRRVRQLRRARKRMLFHHLARPRHDHLRHALVRPDRPAIMQRLRPALLDAREFALPLRAQTQLARNHLLREIPLADEQRHQENPRCEHAPQHRGNGRFQFPKTLDHLRENAAPPQFIRVLIRRCRRLRVQRRTMPDQYQRRVGKIIR